MCRHFGKYLPLTLFSTIHSNAQINTTTRRLTQEGLKYEKIKKCTVIMPRLDLNLDELKPWCLFHNVHGCPCEKYKVSHRVLDRISELWGQIF